MEYKIEPKVSRKIVFIQFIMALIILMVHIGFGGNMEPISEIDEKSYYFFDELVANLVGISVQLYMMMSAFLLYYNCDKYNTLEKFSRRIHSLVIPYLAWNLIYAVYYWIIERENIFSIDKLYQGFLVEPWDGPLWFVLTLISFLPLLFVLGPAKEWWQTIVIIICICFFLKWVNWSEVPVLSWFCNQWNKHGKLYFAGVLLARICPQLVCKTKFNGIKGTLFGVCILLLNQVRRWVYFPLPKWLLPILPLLPVVVLWLSVPIEFSEKVLANKWVNWISKKSFLIFSSHVLVAKIIIRFVFVRYIYPERIYAGYQATIIRITTQLIVFVCLCLLFYMMDKLLPKKIQLIFSGGRGEK